MDEWEDIAIGQPVGAISAPMGGLDEWEDVAVGAPATYGSNALSMLKAAPSNILQGAKNAPAAAYDMVKSIPSGLSNLAHLPMDAAQVSADAVKLGYSKLTGDQFIPTGTQEGSAEVYDRIERTLRGVGLIGAGVASGGTALGPVVGTAAGFTANNKLNQVVGNDTPTTAAEDIKNFEENLGTNAALGVAAKATGATIRGGGNLIKSLPEEARALDRRSLGTRASDYGSTSDLSTILTPEGVPESFVKRTLDDLLDNNKLGTSREPADLLKKVDSNAKELSSAIDTNIKLFDESPKPAPKPDFANALQYIYEGKVPANEVPAYIKRLNELDQGIAEQGNGKLSFLQQQKIALGKNYSTVDAVKAGFEREIYKDLQTTIESAVPEVKGLNAELGKYLIAKPIINRSLKAAENKSVLSQARDFAYTTGGVGVPAYIGTMLGGPVGTAVGTAVGLAGRKLASPTGQASVARLLKKVVGAGERGSITPELLKDVGKLAESKAGKSIILESILDSAEQNKPSDSSGQQKSSIASDPQAQPKLPLESTQSSPILDGLLQSSSSNPKANSTSKLEQLLKRTTSTEKVKDFRLLKTLLGGEMDAPQAEVRGIEDMAINPVVSKFEGGQRLSAYPPPAEGSGVTVATGVDLGQRSLSELKDLGLPENLVTKLSPYLGKKNDQAKSYLKSNPLKLSQSEADQLDNAIGEKISSAISSKYSKETGQDLSSIPEEARTVVESLAYNFGPNLDEKLPTLWSHVVNNDWQGVHDFLIKTKWKQPELSRRRYQEAALLTPLLDRTVA